MLLLDSEALSAMSRGPAQRRDRVRALIAAMRRRELPIATVAAVLAEVVRGRPADAALFAGLRRERVVVHAVDTRVAVRAGQLLGKVRRSTPSWSPSPISREAPSWPPWTLPTCASSPSRPSRWPWCRYNPEVEPGRQCDLAPAALGRPVRLVVLLQFHSASEPRQ